MTQGDLSDDKAWPKELRVNAWTGTDSARTSVASTAESALLGSRLVLSGRFLRPFPVDNKDWTDARVGWGLILAEKPGLSAEALATASDAPDPIQQLLAERKKVAGHAPPIFRFRPDSAYRFTLLRNYGAQKDVAISGSPQGVAPDALPFYLLIYGSPAEVPWEFQYQLNSSRAVGRLGLEGDELANYVKALISNFADSATRRNSALVWAVNHGQPDITQLMRDSVAAKVYAALAGDNDIKDGAKFLDGGAATASGLAQTLKEANPGLIVTTSHGMTGPLNDLGALGATLGMPVDDAKTLVKPADLFAGGWMPDGAIWYAHACCSGGSDTQSQFLEVVTPGSGVDDVLRGIAMVGARIAPLPKALLGAAKPLRAFVGHVEPTFDWTLRYPKTGQFLTAGITESLYTGLYLDEPIGLAFRRFFNVAGEHLAAFARAKDGFQRGEETQSQMLYHMLSWRDIQSTIILGDPAIGLAP